MIDKLVVSIDDNAGHLGKLPIIKAMGGIIKFKKGLNIIVGDKGAGKSAVLDEISNHLAATRTGVSEITNAWLARMQWIKPVDKDGSETFKLKCQVHHDGQAILYSNSTGRSVGTGTYGGLMALGLLGGAGEESVQLADVLLGRRLFPTEVKTSLDLDTVSDVWCRRVKIVLENNFAAKIEVGQPTILMDEPEKNLSMVNQIFLWEEILKSKSTQDKFQIIIVTNNPLCLGIESANYIELSGGFLDSCQ